MPVSTDSPAAAVARAHVAAWSNHDYDAARACLAADITVASTTTQPVMAPVHLTGADAYMEGLVHFAQTVVPGSARVIASTGDDRNALLMLTVEADLGGGKMILPAARLYLLDDDSKIKAEQVIFFAAPE
jgi:ketosteroid isomerase-like protein